MTDRRPDMWMPCEHGSFGNCDGGGVVWSCPGGRIATPDDLIAAVRRGVESGTIEGEVAKWWCTAHGSSSVGVALCDVAALQDWIHTERNGPAPGPCNVGIALVILPDGGDDR